MDSLNKWLEFDPLTLYFYRLILIVNKMANLAMAKKNNFIVTIARIILLSYYAWFFSQCATGRGKGIIKIDILWYYLSQ